MAQERSELRAVAVPAEHGGWGFTLEPILLGLLVAPTPAGFGLAVAAAFSFLARTPLKLALGDRRRGRRLHRTLLAERFSAGYGAAVLAGLGVAVATSRAPFWWPLLAAAPLVGVQLWFDARSRSRRLVPELAGAVAIASVAAAIALAGGETSRVAGGLWLVLGARSVASIPYVRAQIRRGKGQPVRPGPVDLAQAGAVAAMVVAAILDIVPWLGVAGIAILAATSSAWLRRPPLAVKTVGWTQMLLGLLIVALTAVGVRAGL